MSFTSFEEIIQFAKDKEKEAVDFYSDLAKNAIFSGARETLEGFAGEEQKHFDLLEKRKRTWRNINLHGSPI